MDDETNEQMSERAPNTPEASGPKRTLRLAIQLAGFLVGLGLLVWCAKLAFSEKNRAGLERLGDASVGEVSLLLALSCVQACMREEDLF